MNINIIDNKYDKYIIIIYMKYLININKILFINTNEEFIYYKKSRDNKDIFYNHLFYVK